MPPFNKNPKEPLRGVTPGSIPGRLYSGGLPVCLALLMTAALLRLAPAPAQSAEMARKSVRLGHFTGGRTSLFGRAYADGAFDREGVKVALITRWLRGELMLVPKNLKKLAAMERDGGGKMRGNDIIDLMVSGDLDGGLVGEGSFLEAAHDGKPIVAVALLGHDKKDEPGHAIVLRTGVVIRSPADFAGLTLISRRAGPGDAVFLREFLRQEGIPEKSVKVIDQVDDDQQKPMILSGKADGGYMHLMTTAPLLETKEAYVYRPMNWLNPEISLALLVFRRDFLESRRDQVLKIVSGYTKRIAYERTIPKVPRKKTRKHGRTDVLALNVPGMSLPVYDYPPKVRTELLEEMETVMIRHGLLKGTTDLGVFVDGSIVEEVYRDLTQPKAEN